MADKGIAIPTQIVHGRIKLVEKEEQLAKIIMLALADGDSTNPFAPDYGINHPVFALADEVTRSLIKRAIENHFARLEAKSRARLERVVFRGSLGSSGDIPSGLTSPGGDFEVLVHYTSLESGVDSTLTKTFRLGG